jgi:hypothetical protein
MMTKYIAHVRLDEAGKFHTHKLEDHLLGVAELASRFAADFNSVEWGRLATRALRLIIELRIQ